MRILALLAFVLFGTTVAARGLDFAEEMHGYGYWNAEFRDVSFYLDVQIPDIDAWRASAAHPANVTGYTVFDGGAALPITGQLQIMTAVPGVDGRLLVYRLNAASFRYLGAKLVHDDRGFDVVDDVTRLRGVFRTTAQPLPDVHTMLRRAQWSSEVFFEWWRPSVLWDFFVSFTVTNAWWWEHIPVKVLFVETFLGGLAEEFFPWLY